MNAIGLFLLHAEWLHFLGAGAFVAAVGSLKAPTRDSSQSYVTMFAVLNFFALQFSRMAPKVEASPNFQDALNVQQGMAGQAQTTAQVPPLAETRTP